MHTRRRLLGLQQWIYERLCEGRLMKAPGESADVTEFIRQEPKCFIAYFPTRPSPAGMFGETPANVTPSILVMPTQSHVRYTEEQRFDRYNNIKRSRDFAQELNVQILFSVYEPGIRLPGFTESRDPVSGRYDMSLFQEGTQEGLFTLTDWMDECGELLLAEKSIPGTDMVVKESTMTYSLYTDQSYVVDKRPIFYGFMEMGFECWADYPVIQERDSLLN